MLDKDLVTRKIELLIGYLDELETLVSGKTIEDIRADSLKYHSVERLFQLAVDIMIDINVHIIREGGFGAVDDIQSTFKMLGEHKVLEHVFADRIAPIVGARNMIVHRYEKLDMNIFLTKLKNNFSDFKTYLSQIHSYLEKSNN